MNSTKRPDFELYDYQSEGISYTVKQLKEERGFLLCDEMGLGKTIQALETANRLNVFPILIIAPSSCIHVWAEGDIKKYPEFTVSTYVGQNRTFLSATNTPEMCQKKKKVYITSYDTLLNAYKTYISARLDTGQLSNEELVRYCQVNDLQISHLLQIDENVYRRELLAIARKAERQIVNKKTIIQSDITFMQVKWGCLIMDEVHKIKNPKSNRCPAVGFINAQYRLGLTGTPIMNHAIDLLTIWKFGLAFFHLDYVKIRLYPNSVYCTSLMEKIMLRRVKNDIEELKAVLPKRAKSEEDQILEWYEDSEQKERYVSCKTESLNMFAVMQSLKKKRGESDEEFNSRKRSMNMTFMARMQMLRQICLGISPLIPTPSGEGMSGEIPPSRSAETPSGDEIPPHLRRSAEAGTGVRNQKLIRGGVRNQNFKSFH
jgi:SNF2 family DNA or RNA helicase